MPLYNYLGAVMIMGAVFLLLRITLASKFGSSVALYVEALKNENSGRLEDALELYENAYAEAKK